MQTFASTQAFVQQFYLTLHKTQALPRAVLEAYQIKLLEKLVRHARAVVPFYRDSARLAPLFRADGAFDIAGWNDVPILTRAEARQNEKALAADTVPETMRPITQDCTSGSTGTPLRFQRTFLQKIASQALLGRAITWNDRGKLGRLAFSKYVDPMGSAGAAAGGSGIEAAANTPVIPVHLDPARQVAMIAERRPTHVISYPNVVLSWVETGLLDQLSSIRVIVATGEVMKPEVRGRIEAALGVIIIDAYSTSEVGPVAFEGPDRTMRICEESVLVENPEKHVDPSHPCQAVLTPFYAYGFPLIRYAPGDYVRFSSRAPRRAPALRRLDGVLGRERNLFRRPDGTRFTPGLRALDMTKILDYHEWQLVQETIESLVLRIAVPGDPVPDQINALGTWLAQHLPDFRVRVELVDRIADERASGKTYESYISLVP